MTTAAFATRNEAFARNMELLSGQGLFFCWYRTRTAFRPWKLHGTAALRAMGVLSFYMVFKMEKAIRPGRMVRAAFV